MDIEKVRPAIYAVSQYRDGHHARLPNQVRLWEEEGRLQNEWATPPPEEKRATSA